MIGVAFVTHNELLSLTPEFKLEGKELIMSDKSHSYHSGNSRVLGVLFQKQGTKAKYLFFIIPKAIIDF